MAMKTITDRQKSFNEIEATLAVNLEEVLDDLEKILAGSGSESGASAAELGILPRELLAHLKRLLETLLHKDNAAVSGDLEVRASGQSMREAFMATRQELMRTRDMLHNVYKKEDADQLLMGVPKQIPRHVVAGLLRMSRYTLRQLRNPELDPEMHESLKAAYPQGRETFVPRLEGKVDELRKANKRYVKAQVKLAGARVEKEKAMEEYNAAFPEIAKIFECLFRLSGRSELCRSLKPSGQERGLLLKLVNLRRAIRAGMKQGKEERQRAASADESGESPEPS